MSDQNDEARAATRRTVLRRGAGIAVGAASALSTTAFTAPTAVQGPRPTPGRASTPRSGGLPASVAGIRIPDTRLARETVAFARGTCPETLFNHVMRTFLFGALLFEQRGARYDHELVFVAALLHDLGLVEAFRTPTERFEVDGADAAQRFLEQRKVTPPRVALVWDAIALHTTVGIAARKRPEIALISVGSGLDFTGNGLEKIPADARADVLSAFPRAGFKQAALDHILSLCRTKPMAEVMHPFAEVGRRHLPHFPAPTVEDLLLASPFEE
ncbi:HD domain-containing protein [Streptomyces sp. NRRL S-350]|uniref:HD domain-containing protein n=1 Tax=Streptomyces sp. NRRL S-350 TaxID=1463902 RepID=UPI00068E10E9|nr:HD domain-containing protein [Streptomyces sp. NRRL S-350]